VDPHETPPKNVRLFEMLLALTEEEEKVSSQILSSQFEARAEEEECRRQEEKRADPLAPFLARLGDPETLSPQAARKLEEDCLAEIGPQQHLALEEKLSQDPRLAPHL
ncbi:hypothetical protein NHX12_002244, partial [Muraenolepis orangiensis]